MDLRTQDSRRFSGNLVKAFSAINPTAGTGIAEAIKGSFSATAALAILRNAGAGGYVRPKYLRMVCTVAPASGTAMHARLALDKGATRYSSGGSTLTGANRNMASTVAAKATLKLGAVVAGAASANVRYVSQLSPMSVIPVVGDNVIFAFGGEATAMAAAAGMGTLAGTTARQIILNCGPVTLGPGNELLVHTWYPSNAATAASWEVDFCWEESAK